MRNLFILPLLLLGGFTPAPRHAPSFIDPTGTYILKGSIKKNRITGHSGELRVRLVDEHTAALCFYINKGYPGYESGSMLDTLGYNENMINYQPGHDTSCSVVFSFRIQSVEIMEVLTDPRSGCGFGPGVLIPTVFKKASGDVPVIQVLDRRGN